MTVAVLAVAKSVMGMEAVTVDELTKVVVRALPFHKTVAPLTKPVPLTVRVMPAAAPAFACEGEVGQLTVVAQLLAIGWRRRI